LGKLKLAVVYGAICGGCDVALLNWGLKLAEIASKYDIVYWNAAVDSKLEDLEKVDQIDVGVYMGVVRTELHEKLAKTLREKSRIVVAYGACAVYGGIPGLAALTDPGKAFEHVNSTVTTQSREEERALPAYLEMPRMLSTVKPVTRIIEVEVLVPGCPPSDESNDELAKILLEYEPGKEFHGKILLGEENSLCTVCPRRPEDMHRIVMPGIFRLHEVKLDETKCFLEQGVLCMGPATRAACKAPCIKNNYPCIGCMGPAPGVDDVGLKYSSSISSLVLVDKEKELMEYGLAKQLDKVVDPLGVFYAYTLPSSTIYKLAKLRGGGK